MSPAYDAIFNYVAGVHDGEKAIVRLEALTTPEVGAHEQIHEKIFTETVDGVLLALAVRTELASKRAGWEQPDGLTEFVNVLVDGSRNAHESAATYLGIKYYVTASRSFPVDELPKEYQDWYHNLADIIDPVFKASYVQGSVAWGLVHCAFSSRLILSLQDADWRSIIPSANDLPNTRFIRFQATLRATIAQLYIKLEKTFHTFCQQQGVESWEFQSEEAWAQAHQSGNLVKRIDEQLVIETSDWLRHESGIECYDPASDGKAEADARSRLARRLYIELPEAAVQEFRGALRQHMEFDNFGVNEEAFFDAMRKLAGLMVGPIRSESGSLVSMSPDCPQAGAVIANPKAVEIRIRSQPATLLEGDSLFEKLSAVQILSAEPPDHLDHWMLLGTPDTRLHSGSHLVPLDAVLTGRFETRMVLEWLDRRRAHAAEGRRVPMVRSVIVAESSRFDGLRFLTERRTDAEKRAVKDLLFGDLRAKYCRYWCGNWIDCLRKHAALGPLRTKCIPFDAASDLSRRVSTETTDFFGDFGVMVLVGDNVPGCVIRAIANHSALVVMQQVIELFQAGQIAAMSDADDARVDSTVLASMKAILNHWEKF